MLTQCPECDYSLVGLPGDHSCPECGFKYDRHCESYKQLRPISALNSRSGVGLVQAFLLANLGAGFVALFNPSARPVVIIIILLLAAIAFRFLFYLHRLKERGSLVAILPDYLLVRLSTAKEMRIAWLSITGIGQPICPLDVTISTTLGKAYLLLVGIFQSPHQAREFMEKVTSRIEWADPDNPDTKRGLRKPAGEQAGYTEMLTAPPRMAIVEGEAGDRNRTIMDLRPGRDLSRHTYFGPPLLFLILFSLAIAGMFDFARWFTLGMAVIGVAYSIVYYSSRKMPQRMIIDQTGITIMRDNNIILQMPWEYIDHAACGKLNWTLRLIDPHGQVVYRSHQQEFGGFRLMRRCVKEINRLKPVYDNPYPSEKEGTAARMRVPL